MRIAWREAGLLWRSGRLVVAMTLAAAIAQAQSSASLSGLVTEEGRPLEGVRVTVSSRALQGTRSIVTGSLGAYSFAALPPGDYAVVFERSGMITLRGEIALRLSHSSRLDAAMHAMRREEATTVTAAAPLIESAQVSTSLPLVLIERLPLQRNQLATAQFAPGVSGNTLSNGQLQISGGPGYDNLVLVNGVVVTENTRGQMRPMYVEDAIQETTLLTGAISAEYGRFTGGVVNTITRSGGNELTASLRDSLSSPRWSAQTPAGETREPSINHVFEATAGGFAVRDRLWFFTAGRQARNDTARQTVPVPGSGAAPISYSEGNDQKRAELKLTARAADGHTVTASGFGIDTEATNVRSNNNIYDRASLTTRRDRDSLVALHYGGVLRSSVLIEGQYSARTFTGRTGAMSTDLVAGTLLLDRSNNNTRFNSPALCAVCDVDSRDNDDFVVKAHALAGRHELVAGADRFTERRSPNNHQSGSGFALFVSRVESRDGNLYPVVTPTNANGGGSFIRWTPLFAQSRDNELRTDSLFVNDVWSTRRWRLSAGVRWDRNHAADADGSVTANDSRIAPRLSAQYDLNGDGRRRVSASYAEYSSRIADSIASSNQIAGSAAEIDFAHRGPAINDRGLTMTLPEVIASVFATFNDIHGGTGNRASNNLRPNGSRSIPGYSTYFDGTLSSPYVREISTGYATEIGRRGYVRADLIHRDWRDSYAMSVTMSTRRANTPFGIPVDLALIRNSDGLKRRYRALLLQGRWSRSPLDVGTHYTLASLRGNYDGESATSGAVASADPSLFYPELFAHERAAPTGWLQGDQRHRLRVWASFDYRGFAAISLLHNFDSGLPYSMTGPVNLTRYDGAPANPGYNAIPNGLYYFSDRGAFRTDDVHSTDIALRGQLRIGAIELFAQGDLLNVFNRAAIADPQRLGLTVSTAATSSSLRTFDPRTETPIEGVHYQPAANFGRPLNDLAYQRPRTARVSVGVRF